MCEHPIAVKENVTVAKVSHLLLRYRINGLLVVAKNDENSLVGIFTTTDLLRLIDDALSKGRHRINHLKKVSRLAVGKVANKNFVSLKKETKITKAIALMHKKNIHTIPIYEGSKLVGVVGRHDLLNVALNYY
jgi:CBS domain-containing protein